MNNTIPFSDSGYNNFPPIPDPSNEVTGMAELYPKNLQDELNESYYHNKVLPRVPDVDYINKGITGERKETY